MTFIRKHLKFIVLIAILAFVFGAITGSNTNLPKISDLFEKQISGEEKRTLIAPAVDRDGNGVASTLTVIVKPGTGQVLVNINDVLAGVDTQESAKTAAEAAASYTNINLERLDIVYSIEAEAPIVSGASAGAAMALSTVAAIQNKDFASKTTITGAIDSRGNILQVGGVSAKANAVKGEGLDIFLVPKGQGYKKEYQREVNCENVGSVEICKTSYVSTGVSLGKEIGLKILEVSNIEEAVDHLFI